MQSAERLRFLDEQQLYDVERQFHAQQARLSEARRRLAEREAETAALRREIDEATAQREAEAAEAQKERSAAQWKIVSLPAEQTRDGETENLEGEERAIHGILADWGARKPRGIVETVEDWLAVLVSGKTVFLDGGNTIELTVFDQNQRDRFVETVLPLILARKNLEVFVQEHKRREVDFRITVVNKEEAIPAIVVPNETIASRNSVSSGQNAAITAGMDEQGENKEGEATTTTATTTTTTTAEKEEEEHPEVVFVQEAVEDEGIEELRISEMDAISRDVIQSIPEVKEKRRKAKMINLDCNVCSRTVFGSFWCCVW